jgi:hypothetical protein
VTPAIGRRGGTHDAFAAPALPHLPVPTDVSEELELSPPGPKARAAVIVILLAGIGGLAHATLGYSEKGRLFPLLTLGVMALLVLVQGLLLFAEIRQGRNQVRTMGPSTFRRELAVVGWIVALALAVLMFGLMAGVGLFLAAYLMVTRALGPIQVAVFVLVALLGLYGLFVSVLSLQLPGGLLL